MRWKAAEPAPVSGLQSPNTIRLALERYESLPKERSRLARVLEPLSLMFEWERNVATVPLRLLANFHSRLFNLRRLLGAVRHRTLFGDVQL
jgi:hypothetical protein